jgi:hypothetical protein
LVEREILGEGRLIRLAAATDELEIRAISRPRRPSAREGRVEAVPVAFIWGFGG